VCFWVVLSSYGTLMHVIFWICFDIGLNITRMDTNCFAMDFTTPMNWIKQDFGVQNWVSFSYCIQLWFISMYSTFMHLTMFRGMLRLLYCGIKMQVLAIEACKALSQQCMTFCKLLKCIFDMNSEIMSPIWSRKFVYHLWNCVCIAHSNSLR